MVALAAASLTLLALMPSFVGGRSARAARRGLGARARAAACGSGHGSHRDRANPLDLAQAPGRDPLTGARFFVDGPRHGEAAGAIAQLLGVDPHRYGDAYPWARFKASPRRGRFARELAASDTLRWKVHQLEKIANEPEVQRFSVYSMGGGPGKIYGQAVKIFCDNMRADPGSVAIVNTYFLHPVLHGCPSPGELSAAGRTSAAASAR